MSEKINDKDKDNYCVVIGGSNMDIGGKTFAPIIFADSNPGKVSISLGGVARNIAENLSKMNVKVHFITFLGNDKYGKEIDQSCKKLGMDMSSTLIAEQASTPIYLYINNDNGDLALGINDTEIEKYITVDYIKKHLPIINGAKIVVADTNLSEDVLKFLAENCTPPLFIDPVSTTKAMKIKNILNKITILKPNKIEAEKLSGVTINNDDDLNKAGKILIEKGLKKLFISLGSEGVFLADEKMMLKLPAHQFKVENTKGAGDAFTTGLILSSFLNYDTKQMAEYAMNLSEKYLKGELGK